MQISDWWGSGEMPKYTGVLAPSTIWQGDSINSLVIRLVFKETQEPLIPSSVQALIINGHGQVMVDIPTAIANDGSVAIDKVASSVTKNWSRGAYRLLVRYLGSNDRVKTYLTGLVEVM